MRPSGLRITEISSVDSDREDLLPRSPSRRKKPTWRTILTTNLIITIIILLAYTGFLIWIYNNRTITNGVVSIYSGSCSKTSRIATYAQLVANASSVILFATGMYGAKILLSPTREEIDDAHLHDSWVHVGVTGLRNMRWIHKRRMLTCLALGTATILLPFLHNTIIFTTTAATDRTFSLITPDFLHSTHLDESSVHSTFQAQADLYTNISISALSPAGPLPYALILKHLQSNSSTLTPLSPLQCRTLLSSPHLPSKYSNILLLTSYAGISHQNFISGTLQYPELFATPPSKIPLAAVDWVGTQGTSSLFHQPCTNTEFDFGVEDEWNIPVWDYYCQPISHGVGGCLAQGFMEEGGCGVGLQVWVFVAAVASVGVQVVSLASLLFYRGFEQLVTIEDAISSFMQQPDTMTTNSLLSIPSIHSPSSRFAIFGILRSESDIQHWKRKWPVWRAAVDTETCAMFINVIFLSYFGLATATLIIFLSGPLDAFTPLTLRSPTSSTSLLSNLFACSSIHIPLSLFWIFYTHLWERMLVTSSLFSQPLSATTRHNKTMKLLKLLTPLSLLILLALHTLTTLSFRPTVIQIYDIQAKASHQKVSFTTCTPAAMGVLVIGFSLVFGLGTGLERPLTSGRRKRDQRLGYGGGGGGISGGRLGKTREGEGEEVVVGTCSMAFAAACRRACA